MQSILIEDPFISRAALFSARRFALAGCFSPYSGHAFINHPKAVAEKLAQLPHSKNQLACAWLHSQLSFKYTDCREIEEQFGCDIAELISTVASFNVPFTGDTDTLSRFDIEGVKRASEEVQTLILAELVILAETIKTYQPTQLTDYLLWLNYARKAFPLADEALLSEATHMIENSLKHSMVTH